MVHSCYAAQAYVIVNVIDRIHRSQFISPLLICRKRKQMPTVMIAEDDLLVADMLEGVLVDNGYDVCGIARTVDKAIELSERYKPDLAILDIGLAEGGLGTDIPARLKQTDHMGILYASGNVGQMNLTNADGEALISKPFRPEDVIRALKVVEQIVSGQKASRQIPNGFFVLEELSKNASQPNAKEGEVIKQNGRIRRQQAELARFGTFVLGESDLGNVLPVAARVCAECLGAAYCTIYRYRSEENDLIVEAGDGWNLGVIGKVVAKADNSSPHGRAFITRVPVACGDVTKDTTLVQPTLYASHGIISTLDVVIASDYQAYHVPYGVLEIDSCVQRDYDQADTDFLTGIANILAQAIELNQAKDRTARCGRSIVRHGR